VSEINPSSKKLAIWVLLAAAVVCMHASYVSGKKGADQTFYLKAEDGTGKHSQLRHDELELLLTAQRNPADAVEDDSEALVEDPSELDQEDRSLFPSIKAKDKQFHPIIIEVAGRHEVDPALVRAIIMAESGYNPKAVSKRGAKGLMQLMPLTAKSLGVQDIFDPEHNINAGVEYFKRLLNQFDGNVKLALAAYNAGSRKVRKYRGIPPFNATKTYIKKVFEYYEIYKEQM